MNNTIFGKIIRKEIPAEILYEDDVSIAFKDINPQAPIHILIITKELIEMPDKIEEKHQDIVGHLFVVAKILAKELNIEDGYRLVMNNGENAGQSVFHIHLHMLAGRKLGWPPG
ncbi:MAG: histidine triad nucleotide-binding protein [Thermodesulfobacteriota bacterium]|nr:histidine triad nucleotide-binding protein [Thermodesulfobacteriota bacterium]|tara:strand:+ start:1159 stop:1500 length:342 start_codon:yes stop_codon:yes gene_type:complete